MTKAIFQSDVIICPSNSIKNEIVNQFSIIPNKVKVIPHGNSLPMGIKQKPYRHHMESYGNHMRTIWKSYENQMGLTWEAYGNHIGIIWEPYGNHMGTIWEPIWEPYGNQMGTIWESDGVRWESCWKS
jgi:hypothetical protein